MFLPIMKQCDAPKHHNLGLLSFYEIMSLANFEFCQAGNLKTRHLNLN